MTLPPHKRILQHFDISEQGLRELEIWLEKNQEPNWGPWVYVGTAPTDQNITHLSPPFQNSWGNTGTGLQRLRFRRTLPTNLKKKQSMEIEGVIANASAVTDSVVFTLPKGYRPREASGPVVAANTADEVVIWQVATNGDVTYVGPTASGFSTDGIRYDVSNSGEFLRIDTTSASPDSYAVGNETSNWSVGISGDNVAIGAKTNVFVTSVGSATVEANDGILISADADASGSGSLNIRGQLTTFYIVDTIDMQSDSLALACVTGIDLFTSGGTLELEGPTVNVRLKAGGSFTVYDHLGNPIFKVNENGDLQGKTGKALNFNL